MHVALWYALVELASVSIAVRSQKENCIIFLALRPAVKYSEMWRWCSRDDTGEMEPVNGSEFVSYWVDTVVDEDLVVHRGRLASRCTL